MSVLDLLTKSAAERAHAKRLVDLARQAAQHTALDEWVLRDLKDAAPDFRDAMRRPIEFTDSNGRQERYEPSEDLHDDIFLTAHAPGHSRALKAEDMRPSHRFGRDVFEDFIRTDAHQEAKPYTESDELSSAIYARAAQEELDKLAADKAVREQIEQAQDAAREEQRIEEIQQAIDQMREEAKDAKANGDPLPDDFAQDMKDLIGQREGAAERLADIAAQPVKPLPKATREGIAEAAKDAKEHVDTWQSVAGSGADDLGHVEPDQAWALTEKWMQIPNYKEFCRILGRVMRDMRSQEAKNIVGGNDEIIGIEQGNDLTRTLPSELAMLGHPDFQRMFMRNYVDESLLQFQTQSNEKASNGPGIFCVDLSGSMGRALEALATAVGFVRLMHKRKRDAVVICFNRTIKWEHHFKRGDKIDLEHMLSLAGLRGSGGTDITVAVRKAKEYTDRAAAFKKADVVVITDGQDDFSEATDGAIRDHFREKGVRTHGIAIGHTPTQDGWLLRFCDDAIAVKDLTEATGDIVAAVA